MKLNITFNSNKRKILIIEDDLNDPNNAEFNNIADSLKIKSKKCKRLEIKFKFCD